MAAREPELTAADFFQRTAGEYDQPLHEAFYRRVAANLIEMIPAGIAADDILEVGAGSGFATTLLQERFPRAGIVALEPSPRMLARGSSKTAGVEWRCQPLSDMAGSRFDLVTAFMSFHWLGPREQEILFELGMEGMLALALPVTGGTGFGEGTAGGGNTALLELTRLLVVARRWPRSVRRATAVESRLRKHFPQVTRRGIGIHEKYANGRELADSLYVRGALHALFAAEAPQAREILAGKFPAGTAFRWDIKLLVATSWTDS
ncbi:MAG: class I SAM-dependent methyltransferase [Thermoleophilia bacterium]